MNLINNITRRILTASAMIAFIAVGFARAEEYPRGVVKIVSPYAAGGSGDIAARFVADRLGKLWGKPVTVENLPGGGSMIGAGRVATSAPDGLTLLVHGTSLTMVPAVRADLPFDPAKDLVPVAPISLTDFVLVVGPKVGAKTIKDFIKEGKSRESIAATSGPGSSTHFANELIAAAAGIKVRSVHYKGGAEAIIDVVAGRVDFYAATMTTAKPFLDGGKVRALAVMGQNRLSALPDVPTLAESDIDADVGLWWGVFAPAKTSAEVLKKINADVAAAMKSPEAESYLRQQEATYPVLSENGFKAYVEREFVKWKSVAEKQKIQLN